MVNPRDIAGERKKRKKKRKKSVSLWDVHTGYVTRRSVTYSDYTCHDSLKPPAEGGVWNGLSRLAHSHVQSLTSKTSVESVGMNGQIDWQAQQILHLVCGLAGQRCSEA